MLFHAPTIQQIITDASGDLDNIPKPVEALMFAIYLLSVTSMQPEECERILGQPKSSLLSKFSHATQQALVRANYISSLSLTTLQAFALFLVCHPHLAYALVLQIFQNET